MSAIWLRANEHWDQLADLNWMERNLGTFLAPQDLLSLDGSDDRVALVLWDVDSLDAATRNGAGEILHPAGVVVR